jgi:hypothetical protein
MIMEIEKKEKVRGQSSMEFNDSFAEYLVQWKRWQYINRVRGITQFVKSTFSP